MKTVTCPVCERCGDPILKPELGFIIQGNIYTAGVNDRQGIVGNAFPNPNEESKIDVRDIQETCYHKWCLQVVLELNDVVKIRDR